MKQISIFLIMLSFIGIVRSAQAQEVTDSTEITLMDTTKDASATPRPQSAAVPASFVAPGENIIIDPDEHLYSIYLALLDIVEDEYLDSLRIMHIGDSHIRGHILPQTFGAKVQKDFGAVQYRDLGINGATFRSYMNSDNLKEVYAWQPDLVLLSFGTNEAYGKYSPETHYNQIDDLVVLLQENLPYACLLFTTPPGCYLKGGRYNPNNSKCAETICRYARDHGLPVYDIFTVGGGDAHAVSNWKKAGMLRPDGVHFTPAGYRTQGEMLYEAFKRAYEAAKSKM